MRLTIFLIFSIISSSSTLAGQASDICLDYAKDYTSEGDKLENFNAETFEKSRSLLYRCLEMSNNGRLFRKKSRDFRFDETSKRRTTKTKIDECAQKPIEERSECERVHVHTEEIEKIKKTKQCPDWSSNCNRVPLTAEEIIVGDPQYMKIYEVLKRYRTDVFLDSQQVSPPVLPIYKRNHFEVQIPSRNFNNSRVR